MREEGKKNRIDLRRRALAAALGAAPLVAPLASFAPANFIEIVPPVPVDSAPGEDEVIEF